MSFIITSAAPEPASVQGKARREERSLVVPNKFRVTRPCTLAGPALRVVPKSQPGCVAGLGKGNTFPATCALPGWLFGDNAALVMMNDTP